MFISMLHLVIILSLDCRKDVAPSHRICAVESIHGFCGNHFHYGFSQHGSPKIGISDCRPSKTHCTFGRFQVPSGISNNFNVEYISVTCGVLPCKTNHPRIVYWVYLGAMGCKNHDPNRSSLQRWRVQRPEAAPWATLPQRIPRIQRLPGIQPQPGPKKTLLDPVLGVVMGSVVDPMGWPTCSDSSLMGNAPREIECKLDMAKLCPHCICTKAPSVSLDASHILPHISIHIHSCISAQGGLLPAKYVLTRCLPCPHIFSYKLILQYSCCIPAGILNRFGSI